jgi:hypothetical protein
MKVKKLLPFFILILAACLLGCAQKEEKPMPTETAVTPTQTTPPETIPVTTPAVTPTIDINTTIEDIESLMNELKELENIDFNL